MVLWLSSEIFEDTLLPESLHEIPVLNNTMADGVFSRIARDVCLITNVEVYREGREREREREREKTTNHTINTLVLYGIHILTPMIQFSMPKTSTLHTVRLT